MAKNSKKIDVNRRKFLLAATSVTGAVGVARCMNSPASRVRGRRALM